MFVPTNGITSSSNDEHPLSEFNPIYDALDTLTDVIKEHPLNA